jgi:hypothetical protein
VSQLEPKEKKRKEATIARMAEASRAIAQALTEK